MSKIILDLCGGTGAWSKPYKDAGYDVRVITLPDHDVLTFCPPDDVYGILAAPPCTEFSIARQDSTAARPRDFSKGMETVEACLKIIWKCRMTNSLQFWALENPASGYLRHFLGHPALIFEPYHFGDKHSKKTALWGWFKELEKTPIRMNFGDHFENYDSKKVIPDDYKCPPDMDLRQVRRSITPAGFAQAFYKANQ